MAPAIRLLFAALIALASAAGPAMAQPSERYAREVLILLSGHETLPWQVMIRKGIDEQLATYKAEYGDDGPTIHVESLDLYRNPAGADDTRLDDIAARYDLSDIDLVLTEGVLGAQLVEADAGFYPLQAVYDGHAMINFNVPGIGRGEVVDMALLYERTIDMIGRLMPDLGRVIVVGNISPEVVAGISETVASHLDREVEDWTERFTYDELLAEASKLGPDDAIIYNIMYTDKTGATFIPYDVASALSSASGAPVFISFDVMLGSGVVGGYLYSGEVLGRRLIETAYVPTLSWSRDDFYYYGFDETALDRFGLKRTPIPDGAVLLNGAGRHEKSWLDTLLDPLR